MAVMEKQFSNLDIDFTGRTPIGPQTVNKLNTALRDATYLLQECRKRAQNSNHIGDSTTQGGSQSRRLLLPWINGVTLTTTFDGSVPADVSCDCCIGSTPSCNPCAHFNSLCLRSRVQLKSPFSNFLYSFIARQSRLQFAMCY